MKEEPEEGFESREYRKGPNPIDIRKGRNKSIMFEIELVSGSCSQIFGGREEQVSMVGSGCGVGYSAKYKRSNRGGKLKRTAIKAPYLIREDRREG